MLTLSVENYKADLNSKVAGGGWWWFIVLDDTFNNISVMSVLLVEATGVPGENYWQTLSHNVVSSTPRHEH